MKSPGYAGSKIFEWIWQFLYWRRQSCASALRCCRPWCSTTGRLEGRYCWAVSGCQWSITNDTHQKHRPEKLRTIVALIELYIYTVDIASPFWPLSCQRASSFPIHKPVLAPVIYHAVFRIYLSCALMWWWNSPSHNRVWVWRPVFSGHVEVGINALIGDRRSTSISCAYCIEHTSRRTKWVSPLDPFVDTNDTYYGSHEEKASSVPGCSNIVVYLGKWHTFYITCKRLHARKRGVMFFLI